MNKKSNDRRALLKQGALLGGGIILGGGKSEIGDGGGEIDRARNPNTSLH